MMDHFHHGCQVTLLLKFSRFNIDQGKEFIRIHQIEITCQRKVAGGDRISLYERMAEFDIVFSLSTIPEMTQQ